MILAMRGQDFRFLVFDSCVASHCEDHGYGPLLAGSGVRGSRLEGVSDV